MAWNKTIAAILCAAVLGAGVTYLARQSSLSGLAAENRSLRRQLERAQSERLQAVTKAAARELELAGARRDSVALARLREQLRTNSAAPAVPAGFYVGSEQPVYITYGTRDPVLRSFIRTLMDGSYDSTAKGQAIFQKTCAPCHQLDGLGKDGVAPPLVGSEWVLAPGVARLVRIVLNGLTGPIAVQGRDWNLPMPPWRANLDDDAVVVVLNYIRSDLGTNKAGPIKPELVGSARHEQHPGPETAAELSEIPAE